MKRSLKILAAIGAALVLLAALAAAYAWWPGLSLDRALERAGLDENTLRNDRENVRLVVHKQAGRLDLIYKSQMIKTYRVSTGPGIPQGSPPPEKISIRELAFRSLRYHAGDKKHRGDLRTPEGNFRLVEDFRPSRNNYRFARIDYPQNLHRQMSADPGGSIGIHGIGRGLDVFGRLHVLIRHTRGCVALNNYEIDELARVAGRGTRVEILP